MTHFIGLFALEWWSGTEPTISPKCACSGLSSVMVNFVCQLDWAMKCSAISLNIILGVSVRVFLDEFNI